MFSPPAQSTQSPPGGNVSDPSNVLSTPPPQTQTDSPGLEAEQALVSGPIVPPAPVKRGIQQSDSTVFMDFAARMGAVRMKEQQQKVTTGDPNAQIARIDIGAAPHQNDDESLEDADAIRAEEIRSRSAVGFAAYHIVQFDLIAGASRLY